MTDKKKIKMVKLRYRFYVGRLTIGYVKNYIKDLCFENNLSFELVEGFGFLHRPLYVTIYVPKNKIGYVESYMKGVQDD